jgi:hypothetical protein
MSEPNAPENVRCFAALGNAGSHWGHIPVELHLPPSMLMDELERTPGDPLWYRRDPDGHHVCNQIWSKWAFSKEFRSESFLLWPRETEARA